jgi:hypothetical protein
MSYELQRGDIGAHDKPLTPDTIETVTFTDDVDAVEVLNIDGTAAIYFTVNGRDPVVGGNHCWALPAGAASSLVVDVPTAGRSVVKLVSASRVRFSVTRTSGSDR